MNQMRRYTSAVTGAGFHPETRAFFGGRVVAVTGGAGFIGSHLVEQLRVLGARPIVLSRHGAPAHLGDSFTGIELRQIMPS